MTWFTANPTAPFEGADVVFQKHNATNGDFKDGKLAA